MFALASISLSTYLNYCRMAYLANLNKYKSHVSKEMSGLEMYKAMADGRHEGLVDLPEDSTEAIIKWYHSSRFGGHPWEICRGGNTTHIALGILEERGKWFILSGQNGATLRDP